MKNKKLKLATACLLCLGMTGLQAQESTNATGGNATGGGGSASYSVGQIVYATNNGTTGTVAEGVQQPYEISTVVGIAEANNIKLLLSAYPNPTSNYLILNIADYVKTRHDFSQSKLTFELYDMQGKLLQSRKLISTETKIDMSGYVASSYFVKVILKKQDIAQELKTFKIIKN